MPECQKLEMSVRPGWPKCNQLTSLPFKGLTGTSNESECFRIESGVSWNAIYEGFSAHLCIAVEITVMRLLASSIRM